MDCAGDETEGSKAPSSVSNEQGNQACNVKQVC